MNKIVLLISVLFLANNLYASNEVLIKIQGQQAKTLYNAMTGSDVANEGSAGHLHRTGKSVQCIYTNVELNNKHGKPITMQDPAHYVCKINFDANGLATPGQ